MSDDTGEPRCLRKSDSHIDRYSGNGVDRVISSSDDRLDTRPSVTRGIFLEFVVKVIWGGIADFLSHISSGRASVAVHTTPERNNRKEKKRKRASFAARKMRKTIQVLLLRTLSRVAEDDFS